MKIKNLVVNHESQPINLNPASICSTLAFPPLGNLFMFPLTLLQTQKVMSLFTV